MIFETSFASEITYRGWDDGPIAVRCGIFWQPNNRSPLIPNFLDVARAAAPFQRLCRSQTQDVVPVPMSSLGRLAQIVDTLPDLEDAAVYNFVG